jgi:putative flippase GtrA
MTSPNQPVEVPSRKQRQSTARRLMWFLAGSGVNYLLISTPFNYLRTHTGLSILAVAACSLAISTTFFFFWNYFVNFRTTSRKRDAFRRYIMAVTLMWILSTLTLTALKHLNAHLSLQLGSIPLDLDIIATQLFLGGFKFLLYHFWAFPRVKRSAAA